MHNLTIVLKQLLLMLYFTPKTERQANVRIFRPNTDHSVLILTSPTFQCLLQWLSAIYLESCTGNRSPWPGVEGAETARELLSLWMLYCALCPRGQPGSNAFFY